MKNSSVKSYFSIALLLSLAITVTINFPLVMSYFFEEPDGGGQHGERFMVSFTHLGAELVITFVVALLMFCLNYFILRPVDREGKLNPFRVVMAILLTVISVFILNDLLYSFKSMVDTSPRHRGHRDEFVYTNFFVSGLVVGCVLIIRLIFQKQAVQIENESLRRNALQSQFESLKNQLSPHFLFNSLTALKTLINEAPAIAQNYVDNLSKALRYTLQSNEEILVTLKEEMEFTESYLFLIRMRFDTNLTVNTEIGAGYLNHKLPPLTVQTLVENAVKHNEISKRKPLVISIQTTEKESLVVRNLIQEKLTGEEGTGIGLTNLSKQFRLLLGKEIIISMEKNEFRVEVPLINPKQNESTDN